MGGCQRQRLAVRPVDGANVPEPALDFAARPISCTGKNTAIVKRQGHTAGTGGASICEVPRRNKSVLVVSDLSADRKLNRLRDRGLSCGVSAVNDGQTATEFKWQRALNAPKGNQINLR